MSKSTYFEDGLPVDLDVAIIGAGISGINTAYRLQEHRPELSYTIFEARGSLGGTWDLFKFPGIRSDSDLHTFGFPWRPWTSPKTIADGSSIVEYMKECAEAYGIDQRIQYHHKLLSADWSSETQSWTLELDGAGRRKYVRSRFAIFATGYYDYHQPLRADIPGIEKFEGQVVHPQFWPEDLDYTDQNIVIIGSGATAVTLLPNLVDKANHVTMLQRSPGYVVSLPKVDVSARLLKRWLPRTWAYKLIRLKYLILPFIFFKYCRQFPGGARKLLQRRAKEYLPDNFPIKPHFDPKYNPWEQRLCVCPDGDFYKALGSGKADVVTAKIKQVTEKSIELEDNAQKLYPDIIVTATGLKLLIAGGVKIGVDNVPIHYPEKHLWKGSMLQDVPNMVVMLGYTNASWTLGADATAQLVVRLLDHMRSKRLTSVTPRLNHSIGKRPVLNLNSTYVTSAEGALPKAGDEYPWLPRTTYFTDLWEAKHGNLMKGLEVQTKLS